MRTWITPTRESLRDNVAALRTLVGFPSGRPPEDTVLGFEANEKAYAAYGQLEYEFGGGVPIDGVIGLRVVRTEISVSGTSRNDTGTGVTFTPRTEESEYTDYLPSVTARVRLSDDVQLRLAANKTRTRPDFRQINPGLVVSPTVESGGRRNARSGNIDLQPIESENFDAALEYYFSPTGAATLTLFRRNVDGFIADQTVDVTDPVFGSLRLRRPQNLNKSILQGFEAAFTTFFDYEFLPGWAQGFGVQLNHTYIEGSRLPGISKSSSNVVGIYERGPVSTRLAYNHRSEFTPVGAPGGEFADEVSRLDFSSSYTPIENITVTFDVSNILGEPFRNFLDFGPGVYSRDVRFEETIYSLGVRFRL